MLHPAFSFCETQSQNPHPSRNVRRDAAPGLGPSLYPCLCALLMSLAYALGYAKRHQRPVCTSTGPCGWNTEGLQGGHLGRSLLSGRMARRQTVSLQMRMQKVNAHRRPRRCEKCPTNWFHAGSRGEPIAAVIPGSEGGALKDAAIGLTLANPVESK